MERLLWFNTQTLDSGDSHNVAGIYTSRIGGATCTLQVAADAKGVLTGTFCYDDDELELTASISKRTGHAYGFLLEPSAHAPVAFFRAKLAHDGVVLELDVPDFDEMIDNCGLERIVLQRTPQSRIEG